MDANDARCDANIRQFSSRAKQPKTWSCGNVPMQTVTASDQGFSSSVDDMRFKYLGTSPQVSKHENMNARKINQLFMGERA